MPIKSRKMRLKLIILFAVIFFKCYTQNLILNGTFEDANLCTELKMYCSPEAWRLTSQNKFPYFRYPNNNSAAFTVYNISVPNKRNYLESRLADRLKIGETYRLSMDILAERLLINKIGVLFSNELILQVADTLLNTKPDIEFEVQEQVSNNKQVTSWLHLEKEFVADKKSLFITLGNFEADESELTKKIEKITTSRGYYYYFIDNIQLESIHNLHKMSDIKYVKNNIYSQNERHPVGNYLKNLRPDDYKATKQNKKIISNTNLVQLNNDLLFEFNSYKPSNCLIEIVDSIFKKIKYSVDSIIVVGHTDSIGSEDYNNELSLKRAEVVAYYIYGKNIIPNEKISYSGNGSLYPIATNSTLEGRNKNRRVELIIKYKKNKFVIKPKPNK